MHKQPTVSVIIPCWNQGRFLAQAIESVLTQTLAAVETVVVDDGSQDDTAAVARRYRGRGVRLVRQANRGPAAARNRGIAAARGGFLTFLDADDWFAPDKLRRQVEALAGRPEAEIAFCDIQVVDEAGVATGTYSVKSALRPFSEDLLAALLVGGFMPPCACLVRRSLAERVGGFDAARELQGNEDYEFWLRAAAAGAKAVFVDRKDAFYRRHAGNLSRDEAVMEASCRTALVKTARAYPERCAAALGGLQGVQRELHAGVRFLEGELNAQRQAAAAAARLREELAAAAGRAEALEAEVAALRAQAAAWQSERDASAREAAKLREALEDARTARAAQARELSVVERQRGELARQAEQWRPAQGALESLRLRLATERAERSAARAEADGLRARLAEAEDRLTRRETACAHAAAEAAEQRVAAAAARDQARACRELLAVRAEEAAGLRQALGALREQTARIAPLERRLERAEARAAALAQAEIERDALQAKRLELEQWTTRQQQQVDELGGWSERHARRAAELESELAAARSDASARAAECQALARALREAGWPNRLRRRVHVWLDALARVAPEPLRAAVRPAYLPLYRLCFGTWREAQGGPLRIAPAALPAALPAPARAEPLISVVLPVWNHAGMLGGALRSVLEQTHRNLELILVDDGSEADLTPVLRAAAQDPRVRVVRRPHEGLPAALNAGFRHAQGVYWTWTSADNLMRPAMLERLRDYLERHPAAEMVYADMELIDAAGRPFENSGYRPQAQRPGATHRLTLPRSAETLGLTNDNFIGACFLYRAEAGRALGPYDTALLGTEDYDYWLRMSLLGRIDHLDSDECLYAYRVHDDSLSGRYPKAIRENSQDLIAYHRERGRAVRAPFPFRISGGDERAREEWTEACVACGGRAEQGDGARVEIDLERMAPGSQHDYELELLLARKARDARSTPFDFTPPGGPVALVLGPLDDRCVDWTLLDRVAAEQPDWTFLFVATTPDAAVEPAARLRPRAGLHFVHAKPAAQWWHYLSCADVALAPFRVSDAWRAHIADAVTAALAAGRAIAATPEVEALWGGVPGMTVADGPAFAQAAQYALATPPPLAAVDEHLTRHAPAGVVRRLAAAAGLRAFFEQTRAPQPAAWQRRPAALLETLTLDAGGLERVVADMAQGLQRSGWRAAIAVREQDGRIGQECRAAGLPVLLAPGANGSFKKALAESAPHLVVAHYSTRGAHDAWRAGIPVVSVVHNSYLWADDALARQVQEADLYTSAYSAVSDTARDFFARRFGVRAEKITVIPNGVDTERLEAARRAPPRMTRATLGLRETDLVALQVASLIGTKAQVHALAALAAAGDPRLKLVLVGAAADAAYERVIRERIGALGLGSRVLVCPPTPGIADYYRLADVFFQPSLTEGWSLALTEAMYFGLPLIATAVGGAAAVIENGDIGQLVPPAYDDPLEVSAANLWDLCTTPQPRNLRALTAALQAFASAPEEWRARGRGGTRKVRERYTAEAAAARYHEFFRGILECHYGG